MELILIGHQDRYAVEQLQMALFPGHTPGVAQSKLCRGKTWLTAITTITLDGRTVTAARRLRAGQETVPLRRRCLQQSFYLAAVQLLPEKPAWGALAGVRPTKLTTRMLLEGKSPAQVKKAMEQCYFVTPERSRLALSCSQATVQAMEQLAASDLSIYVGIPFCPTRCAYCSFVSRSIGKKTDLLEPYLEVLFREIAITGELLRQSGRTLRTLYIGGGTPTTLSSRQMARLLEALNTHFDLGRCLEFTVEAGRPDTLDREKLQVIRQGGARRISINPQTMEDSVLAACGRLHSAKDILTIYDQAAALGFSQINMDLIAGLPTDTLEGFCRSLDQVAALAPANITLHTLALKKDAELFTRRQSLPDREQVAAMLAYGSAALSRLGYAPYYLYRQKYMSGSFENVGWTRPGDACLYNIYMMEEVHSIVSLGGGGMSKINLPGGKLQRFHNAKLPEQYIAAAGQLPEQKEQIFRLLAQHRL